MFKWIILFFALILFVGLTFTGTMLDVYFMLFAKAMLLTFVVLAMLYFAKAAHHDAETLS